ncbi:MAG: thiamine pyrophosphate-binding protein, partial [Burkholderiales bacterium]|nr:thiamine pyrophosphate-binding protein [Burkholderiales bacterium]
MTMLTGAQALVQSLKANRIDTVFGLPGVQLDHVFEELYQERSAIRVINSRHEQGVAYMAYGYAESTGKLGTFMVVPGPGLLNTATPICIARASNTPVLAISGQLSTRYIGRGLGIMHEVHDQPGVFASFTKRQVFADHPSRVPAAVDAAVRAALSRRCGPVLFEIPDDVTEARGEVTLLAAATREADPAPDPALIERAAELLQGARCPAFFVGGGIFGAEQDLLAIAEKLQAAIIMTRHGRGAVSDRHYLAQTLFGGHALWPEVDVVVAVGTRFLEGGDWWGLDAGIRTIRIDIDPLQAEKPAPADVKIITSAAKGLGALRAALGGAPRASRRAEFEALKRAAQGKLDALAPQKAYSDAIRAALPDEAIVVADITQVGFYAWSGFPVYSPRTLIHSGYQNSLGFGYATSLGVKVAHPDRPVVAICGDGGFMFTMPELASAMQHGIHTVAIVFNDSGFGNVRRTQKLRFAEHYVGCDLSNPDFVALAGLFGALGLRADSPEMLGQQLGKALAAGGPALIEVPVGLMPAWEPLIPRS